MAINNKYLHTVYSHSIIGLLHTVRFVVNLLNSGFPVQLLKYHSVFIFIRNDALAGQSVTPSVS